MIERLHHAYPKSVAVSAVTGDGLDDLAEMISEELSSWRVRIEELVPYGDPVLGLIRARGRVISEVYREDGVAIVAEVDRMVAGQVRKARSNGSKRQ
jgi:GTP-binding protein HflX